MKRRFLSLLCAALLLLSLSPAALAAAPAPSSREADVLAALGVVRGSSTGDYALADRATRAQAAVLLVRLSGRTEDARSDPWFAGFPDLPPWAADSIDFAAHQGWMQGCTPFAFRPDAPITAEAWCVSLLRLLGYREQQQNFTYGDAMLFARRIGLFDRSFSGPLDRSGLFAMAHAALTFPYRDTEETVAARLARREPSVRAAAKALGLLSPAPPTPQALVQHHGAAVFRINAFESDDEQAEHVPGSTASGFFITPEGLAVTNYHALAEALSATVTLNNGEEFPLTHVLWYDRKADLALIRVGRISLAGRTSSGFPTLEMTGSRDVRPGDKVYTLGHPLGLGIAITDGMVSAVDRKVPLFSLPCIVSTAHISQGSSGGALLNAQGLVVGVTAGAYAYGNSMYLTLPVDILLTMDPAALHEQPFAAFRAEQVAFAEAEAAAI